MFVYEKKLQYPVRIANPNPKLAAFIISQYGGPDGELGASLRYLSQRYSMPYDMEQDRLCDTLELNLCKGDGSEESWSCPLNAAEQEVLLRKMEAFCQQQTGMSLHEYAQQLRDSESQTPEMQM